MPYANPYESYSGPTNFPGADCTPPVFPDPVFLDCPDAYTAHEGEIDELFITNVVRNATTGIWEAVTTPANATAIASFLVTGIERLIGFGDKPLPEVFTIPLPKNKVKTVGRRHALNFDFTDQLLANYDLVRALQGTQYLAFWYKSIDGALFGGIPGIIGRVVNAGNVHSRGENALLTGQIILSWDNLFDPPRTQLDAPAPLMAKIPQPEALKSKRQLSEATV